MSVVAKECLGVPLLPPGLAVGQCSVLNTVTVQVRPSISSLGAMTKPVTAVARDREDTECLAPAPPEKPPPVSLPGEDEGTGATSCPDRQKLPLFWRTVPDETSEGSATLWDPLWGGLGLPWHSSHIMLKGPR